MRGGGEMGLYLVSTNFAAKSMVQKVFFPQLNIVTVIKYMLVSFTFRDLIK